MLTFEYRAVKFSTLISPLVGYAAGAGWGIKSPKIERWALLPVGGRLNGGGEGEGVASAAARWEFRVVRDMLGFYN